MKNLLLILSLIIANSVNGQDSGKLSKTEKKALVKQAKMYKSDPSKLKAFNEQLNGLQIEISSARQEINTSKEQITVLNNKVEELENQLTEANSKKTVGIMMPDIIVPKVTSNVGLTFKVQIGGYRKRDLSAFDDSKEELVKVEVNGAGIQEIALGNFDSYQKANDFKKHLRAMGLKDSWIVPFEDGMRVSLKDVVDQLELK